MIRKIFFIPGFALMLQFIVACVNCNCPPIKTIYYTNKGISLKNMDSGLPQPMVTSAGIIASANYGIQVQLSTQQLTVLRPQLVWGFMQSAYACSCPEDDFISKEDIRTLTIFSNQDFDADHPKNTDLSLYFKAKRNNTMLPIIEYIKSSKDMDYISSYFFYEGIFLQSAPTAGKKHKFKVIITLTDGRILAAETTEVELS